MEKNFQLKQHNTFGFNVSCAYFSEIKSEADFSTLIQTNLFKNERHLILGGGSNVLFTNDFDGLVVWNQMKGISVISETSNDITLRVGAGEVWHDFVMYCVEKNYGGIENLSLIPGFVGAAPMQNIGAYGSEIKDTCVAVEFIDISNGSKNQLTNAECEFGYRESIFKHQLKGQIFITAVHFKLNKQPQVNTAYGVIEQELANMNISTPTIADVSKAVVAIRESKLPNPKEIGNSGSFFKNPVIENELAGHIKKEHPNMPTYPSGNKTKVAAGWLIEQAGWKGTTRNEIGVHKKQALVLVNYGQGLGKEILQLSKDIQRDVFNKFGIELEREVNLIE